MRMCERVGNVPRILNDQAPYINQLYLFYNLYYLLKYNINIHQNQDFTRIY